MSIKQAVDQLGEDEILMLVNLWGVEGAARDLSERGFNVSVWSLGRWLKQNGYERIVAYRLKEQAS